MMTEEVVEVPEDASPATWDADLLRRFARATHAKKAAEAALTKAKAIIAELDPEIQMMFADHGTPSAKVVTEAFDAAATAVDIMGRLDAEAIGFPEAAAIATALDEAGLLIDSTPKRTTTIYIGSRLWARPNVDKDATDEEKAIARAAAVEALKSYGYGEFIKEDFNIVSLSSAMKLAVESGEVPLGTEFFDGALNITEDFAVGARVKNG